MKEGSFSLCLVLEKVLSTEKKMSRIVIFLCLDTMEKGKEGGRDGKRFSSSFYLKDGKESLGKCITQRI